MLIYCTTTSNILFDQIVNAAAYNKRDISTFAQKCINSIIKKFVGEQLAANMPDVSFGIFCLKNKK